MEPSTTTTVKGTAAATAAPGKKETSPIDAVVQQVEKLYRAVSGTEPPPADVAVTEIPPEKDPGQFLEAQVDRLLSVLSGGSAPAQEPAWLPPVSLSETQDEYIYQIDLAGVRKDDVRVSVIAGGIDVSGNRQAGLNLGAQRALASERPMGTFRRALPLPVDITVNGLSAQLSDGVLSIRVPRARATQGAVRGVPIS